MDDALEIAAYHEAGHAVIAVLLGGKVQTVSLLPETDAGPRREAEIEVHWPRAQLSDRQIQVRSAQVALAGPAAEMIYRGEPLHPGFVREWSGDWNTAWQATAAIWPQERQRLANLERLTVGLRETLASDRAWQAVAALADELLAHELLEWPDVYEILTLWLAPLAEDSEPLW